MSVFSFIQNTIKPTTELIDTLTTTKEEKLELKKQIMEVENQLQLKILEYEKQLLTARSDIIKSEATGRSWLQRNWRPITMLTFLILVIFDSFHIIPGFSLNKAAWGLLKIGLGGYVVGRSAEKIVPQVWKKGDTGAKG
jgi:hypothetical protein